MNSILLFFIVLCVFWGVISMMAMVSFCSERGIKINWLLIRLFVFKYVNQYRSITSKETGKPGSWYYSFVVSMMSALVLTIIGLLTKSM